MAKKHMPYDIPLISERYVFFNSLFDSDNPPSLQAFGTHAKNQINAIINLMSNGGNDYISESEQQMYSIDAYIQFVEEMASAESAAENRFFDQQIALLKQNKENELATELESYRIGSEKDPKEYILLTNKILQDASLFEERVNSAFERIRSISDNMSQIGEDAKNTIKKAFEESYRTYQSELMKNFKSLGENMNTTFESVKNINSQLAARINNIIRTIANNDSFIQQLTNAYKEHGDISDTQFKQIIINTITNSVLNNQTNFSDTISDDISSILTQIIDNLDNTSSLKNQDYYKVFNLSSVENIETAALNLDKSIANIILELDEPSIKEIKKHYRKSAPLIDKLLEAKSTYSANDSKLTAIKKQTTEALRSQILARAKIKREELKNKSKRATFKDQLKEKNLITSISLSDSLDTYLKHVSISHDAVAEAVTSKDALEKIKNILVAEIPGKLIQLKADIRFSTGYIDSNATLIDGSSVKNIVDETISLFYKDFMEDYKIEGSGATDVNAAITAYTNQLIKMKEHIDKIVTENHLPDESRLQLYQALSETFSSSVSVKDYDLYNNELGVHGGKLGAGSIPENVINNITKMYELGGITAVDVNKVLFAVLNCGDDAVGAGTKEHIETYLLGGAALIMFDEGFVNTKNFFQYVENHLKAGLDGFTGQQGVHFYRVGPLYIPCSYILSTIAKNLRKIYLDVSNRLNFSQIKSDNRVTIINNINSSIIPDAKKVPEAKKRWETVSSIAQSKIKITFSFMAGLLDILENFQTAVQIS